MRFPCVADKENKAGKQESDCKHWLLVHTYDRYQTVDAELETKEAHWRRDIGSGCWEKVESASGGAVRRVEQT